MWATEMKDPELNCEIQRATKVEKSCHKQWWLPGPNPCLTPSPWAVLPESPADHSWLLSPARGEQLLSPEQQGILCVVMMQHRGDGDEQGQEPAPWREWIERILGDLDPWNPGNLGQYNSSGLQRYTQELRAETKHMSLEKMMLLFKKSIVAEKQDAPFRHHCGAVKKEFYL